MYMFLTACYSHCQMQSLLWNSQQPGLPIAATPGPAVEELEMGLLQWLRLQHVSFWGQELEAHLCSLQNKV